ncbi:serine/threonine protein kinase [Pseudomonas aeruginosa]|nr:serine/threonine protein kinase [Pseudomonas aeruginosa]
MDIELPGFDIERELGEGAMATVYLATQRSLQRKVALKVMAAALAADPSFAERFLREGRTLARLSHPNTVTIHDIGNVGSCYYMAMEYLPNGTLKERIQQGLDPEQGLAYVRQVAAALGYAHSQGLVHRDVKPANILFRADGTAVLSDFGIAKSIEDNTQFTQVGFAVGTPSYMSPEQAAGRRSTAAPTSTRWAWCSTRSSPASCPTTARTRSPPPWPTSPSRCRNCRSSRAATRTSCASCWPRTRPSASPLPAR